MKRQTGSSEVEEIVVVSCAFIPNAVEKGNSGGSFDQGLPPLHTYDHIIDYDFGFNI